MARSAIDRRAQPARPGDGAVGVVGDRARRRRARPGTYFARQTHVGSRIGSVGLLVVRCASTTTGSAAPVPAARSASRSCLLVARAGARRRRRTSTAPPAGSAPGRSSIQPSELAKLALLLFVADLLARRARVDATTRACTLLAGDRRARRWSRGLVMLAAQPRHDDRARRHRRSSMLFVAGTPTGRLGAGGRRRRAFGAVGDGAQHAVPAGPRASRSSTRGTTRGNTGYQNHPVAGRPRRPAGCSASGSARPGPSGASCPTPTPTSSSPSSARSSAWSARCSWSALFVALGVLGVRAALQRARPVRHAGRRRASRRGSCVQAFVNIGAVIGLLPDHRRAAAVHLLRRLVAARRRWRRRAPAERGPPAADRRPARAAHRASMTFAARRRRRHRRPPAARARRRRGAGRRGATSRSSDPLRRQRPRRRGRRSCPRPASRLDELPGRGIQRRLTLRQRRAPRSGSSAAPSAASGSCAAAGPRWWSCSAATPASPAGSARCWPACRSWSLEQNVRAGAANRLARRFATRQRGVASRAPTCRGRWSPATRCGPRSRRPPRRPRPRRGPRGARPPGRPHRDRRVQRLARVAPDQRGGARAWSSAGPTASDLAVRHVVGQRDWPTYSRRLAGAAGPGGSLYRPVEYEDRMHLLLPAADVAVTRAGGTVAELAALGVPAVLVPLPIATRDHQTANARGRGRRGRCGRRARRRARRRPAGRRGRRRSLADPDRRAAMAAAMRAAARPDAADRVAALVESVARPALGTG